MRFFKQREYCRRRTSMDRACDCAESKKINDLMRSAISERYPDEYMYMTRSSPPSRPNTPILYLTHDLPSEVTDKVMRIDEILRTEGLDAFVSRTKIKMVRHGVYDNLVLLKYDMLNCDMSDPAVQQCRGVIVDEEDAFRIVSFPYTKFFNYGDVLTHDINWANAKVFEKLDGSIMTMYHYHNRWHVQSNGMPDASGNVGFGKQTFEGLFWETFYAKGYRFPKDTSSCYMFELMTPKNRVVVKHDTPRLVLHGARNLHTYEEVCANDSQLSELGWEVVKTYPITTLLEAVDAAEDLPGVEREGFVVVDQMFNRLKIKSKDYVRLHHLVSGMSYRVLLEIIQKGDVEEFLGYFPEYGDAMEEVREEFRALHNSASELYNTHKNIKSQKDFAMAIKGHPLTAAIFQVRANKVDSIRTWMMQNNSRRMLKLLGLSSKDQDAG